MLIKQITAIYIFIEMLGATLTKTAVRSPLVAQQVRNMTVVSGPPRVKISTTEKALHGLAIGVGMSVVPVWVLANLKSYKQE